MCLCYPYEKKGLLKAYSNMDMMIPTCRLPFRELK